MRTPQQAIVWELWRTSRLELLMVLAGQMAFVGLIATLNVYNPKLSTEVAAPVLAGIFVMTATICSCFSQSWRHSFESVPGFSFRLGFTRPISAAQMVLVPMLFIALTAPTCYLVPALFFQWIMGIQVPMLFPALLSTCCVCGLATAAWTPTTNVGKAIGLTIFAMLLIAGLALFHFTRHHPDPLLMAIGRIEYYRLAWYEYLVLIALPMVAVALTVVGVKHQRHGEKWRIEELRSWFRKSAAAPDFRHARTLLPFRSKLAAQVWYEMQRFGFKMLIFGALAPLLPLVLLTSSSLANPNGNQEPAFWLAAIVLFPIAYQMVGADAGLGIRVKQGAVQFPAFDATRPLRNDQVIAIKLLLITTCSLLSWLWLWIVALGQGGLSGDWPAWMELANRLATAANRLPDRIPVYWWICGAISFAFLNLTSTSMMLAIGMWTPLHPRLLATLTAIGFAHYLLAVWDFAHGGALRLLWIFYAWVGAFVIVGLCAWAIRRTLASGFLSMNFFLIAGAAWLVYFACSVPVLAQFASLLPIGAVALILASLLIPLATTAMAPLALAAYRNGAN